MQPLGDSRCLFQTPRQQPFRCFQNHQVPNIQIDLIVLQFS